MNEKYISINGNKPLSGSIEINGAKNSVLGLMIATVMTKGVVTLEDVPEISDVKKLQKILQRMGSNVILAEQGTKNILTIDNTNSEYCDLVMEDVASFRASYYFMGAFVSMYKKCEIAFPGGCYLGPRPIDLHVKALEQMGCSVSEYDKGDLHVLKLEVKDKLKGERIFLDFPSVGATINIMLAAAMAEGETTIENAAKEPEIVDVATLLSNMGVRIVGAGTDEIIIHGTENLKGCYHQVIPDRIEAGTYLMIGALLGEPGFKIKNIIPEHMDALVSKLQDIGIYMDVKDEEIVIQGRKEELNTVKMKTGVYPTFPTDLQQIFVTLLTQIKGESRVIETIFPERFRNCEYLNLMGANIDIKTTEAAGYANVTGKTDLVGSEVYATDLRAGASLIFAGLIAEGNTTIKNISHILRGYDSIVPKLQSVGADIELIVEANDE